MAQASVNSAHPLACLSVQNDADALLILPKGYVDMRFPISALNGIPMGDDQIRLYEAVVEQKSAIDQNGLETTSLKPVRIDFRLRLRSGDMANARIFGATFSWREIQPGDTIQFTAKLIKEFLEPAFKGMERATATGRVHALYSGVQGQIASAVIEPIVTRAMTDRDMVVRVAKKIRENAEIVSVLKAFRYSNGVRFLEALHRPENLEAGYQALKGARLACVQQVRSAGRARPAEGKAAYNIDQALVGLVRAQAEKLSAGQSKALNAIRRAINASASAKILLNGDVGSGKTLVFLLAAAAVAQCSGRRVAVMVPSDLVARQITAQAQARFPQLRPCQVESGSAGSIPIESQMLIGTQVLLNMPTPPPLGLLVIDEQHKLSVEQRATLVTGTTHVIEASATPIPRSLALALFDGWREARIDGCPVDKKITSAILTPDSRSQAQASVLRSIEAGGRTIMVYPSVKSGHKSANEAFKRMSGIHPGKIGLIHGKMKPQEKMLALARFKAGEFPVLISTTVIEVGVDVPGIVAMVVHEAQTFGVSQLHQMRGRLVRNGGHGQFFMMVANSVSRQTLARLEAVRDNLNGFELAERDMELRGFGDVLGEAQSGGTSTFFKMARLEAKDFLP